MKTQDFHDAKEFLEDDYDCVATVEDDPESILVSLGNEYKDADGADIHALVVEMENRLQENGLKFTHNEKESYNQSEHPSLMFTPA